VSAQTTPRLRGEQGWTLIELLVAMTLMLIVLSATLTSFEGFTSRSATASKQNDTLDQARASSEVLARQLRNLASAKPNSGVASSFYALDYWTPYDLVFKSADPTRRRVRYCLDNRDPNNEIVWQQLEAVAAAGDADPPFTHDMVATCPVAPAINQWASATQVTHWGVNRRAGQDRPLFQYDAPQPAGLPVPATNDSDFLTWGDQGTSVKRIRTNLWIDVNAANKDPREASLSSAVYLRNQNQKPTVSFTGTPSSQHQVILNGSASNDPEGRTLLYRWYLGTSYPGCPAGDGGAGYTLMGTGITLTYAFPDGSDQRVTLEVTDPGGLCASLPKTVHPDSPTP
jgi:prepilin-type N-terminal cleavage/methylation domain-containing protein